MARDQAQEGSHPPTLDPLQIDETETLDRADLPRRSLHQKDSRDRLDPPPDTVHASQDLQSVAAPSSRLPPPPVDHSSRSADRLSVRYKRKQERELLYLSHRFGVTVRCHFGTRTILQPRF